MAERSNWAPLALILLLLAAGGGIWWSLSGGSDDVVLDGEREEGLSDEERAAARRRAETVGPTGPDNDPEEVTAPVEDDAADSAALIGIVVDGASGREIANARILASDADGRRREGASGSDGSFRLGLPPGDWTLRAIAVNRASASQSIAGLADGEERDLGVLLVEPTSVITGRVVDTELRPLAGIEVALHRGSSLGGGGIDLFGIIREIIDPNPAIATQRTGEDGLFRFENVVNGDYALTAEGEGWRRAISDRRQIDDRVGESRVDFVMSPGVELVGRCVDEADAPVVGAKLVVLAETGGVPGPGAARIAETDAEGRFRVSGVEMTEHEILARHPDYTAASRSRGRPGEEIVIKLSRGATITGLVTDADSGQPVAGLKLFMMCNERPAILETVTDETGRYRLEHAPDTATIMIMLRSNRYFLKPEGDGSGRRGGMGGMGGQVTIPRSESPRGETSKDFLVQQGGTLEGRVVDSATGEVVAGAEVRNVDPGSMFTGMAGGTTPSKTDAEGRFRLTNVRPGPVMLMASHPDFAPPSVTELQQLFGGMMGGRAAAGSTQQLAAGQTLSDLNVTVMKGVTLRGTVVNEDGDPVSRARVEVTSEGGMGLSRMMGGMTREAFTDAEGRFELRGVGKVPDAAEGADENSMETMMMMAMKAKIVASHPAYAGGGGTELKTPGGKAPEEMRIVIKRGASLTGRLLDGNGSPARGRRLEFSVENEGMAGGSMMDMFVGRDANSYRATTDAEGRFAIPSMPHGEVSVEIEDQESGWLEEETAKFSLSPGEKKEILLRMLPTEIISGVVVDEDGNPVSAMVNIDVEGNQAWNAAWSVQSDADDGSFTIKNIPMGKAVSLNVWHWENGESKYETIREEGIKPGTGMRFVLKAKAEEPKEADGGN